MRFRIARLLVWSALFISFATLNQLDAASIIRVPSDQPTIQSAINAASSGDAVLVAPGTYFENLNFLGKAIRLASEQGPQVTIIDGNQAGPVVIFASGEGPQSVLSGFTIRNGKASVSPALQGGGIRISNSSPTITGNIISNNLAGDAGGGIASSFGSPIIQSNIIKNNGQISGWSGGVGGGGIAIVGASSAQLLSNTITDNSWYSSSGGGVSLFAAGTPVIQNNVVANNSAYSQGGGFYIVNQSDAAIVQNVIVGNSAGAGGGVYWMVPSGARGPFLVNNAFYNNPSPQGSGIFANGFDAQAQLTNNIIVAAPGQTAVQCGNFDSSIPVFHTNDVFSASGTPYGGICASQTGLNGDISADPRFVNADAGDFRLQSLSPAIDSGTPVQTPQADLDGVSRPLDGDGNGVAVIDMGVYEAPLLDRTPPTSVASLSVSPNGAGWNKTNVSVTITGTDNPGGSGVQNIRYSLTGAQSSPVTVAGNPAAIAITTEGITTVGYEAVDYAGNVEASKFQPVRLDKTGPVITGMPAPGCTLSPAKHQLVQVASVSASDSVSGVLSFTVTATSNEPDSGTGGGDAAGDIVINGGTVQLRAERSPSGKGRIYTIVATAQDVAGNTTTTTATCSVPK
jgi:hypothetical protein